MASEIRVDKINSLSGVGTVTLSPTGVDISGITTAATLRATTGIVTSLTAVSSAKVGSGVTLSPDGDIFATGVTTSTTFVGALTGNVTGNISGGTVAGSTGTFSGDITANGDITGDGSTDLSGINDATISTLIISDTIAHSGDTNTKIRFPSADTITAETGGSERLRIDSNGRLLIGNTDGATYADSSNDDLIIGSTASGKNDGITILSGTGQNGTLAFADSGGAYQGLVGYVHNGDYLRLHAGNTLKVRIDTDGLKFNSDTAAANALNDYEEGTFTLAASSMGVTNTDCKYVKIGRLVHCTGRIATGSAGNGSLVAQFSGLPFAGQTGTVNGGQGGTVPVHDVGVTLFTSLVSNSSMRMNNDTGSAYTLSTIDDKQMDFNITYYTT